MTNLRVPVLGGITGVDADHKVNATLRSIETQVNVASALAEANYLDALESTAERIARETTIVSLTREGDAMALYTRHGDHEVKAARICDALTIADLREMLSNAVEIHARRLITPPQRRMFDTAEIGAEQ